MAVTVYADVLVIVNLYVDFFLLWCHPAGCSSCGQSPGGWRRGPWWAALCALACLLPGSPGGLSLLWGGVSAAAVTAAAFCPLSRRGFLKAALCFWVFSLGLAGLCLFLIQWAGARSLAVVGHAVYLDLSLPLLFACTAGAYGVLWALQKLFHREDSGPRACRLAITYQGEDRHPMGQGGHRLRPAGALFRAAGDRLPGQRPEGPCCPQGPGRGLPGRACGWCPLRAWGALGCCRPSGRTACRLEPAGHVPACYVALWERGPAGPGSPPGLPSPVRAGPVPGALPHPLKSPTQKEVFAMFPSIGQFFAWLFDKLFPPETPGCHYINGPETLPPPLTKEEEAQVLENIRQGLPGAREPLDHPQPAAGGVHRQESSKAPAPAWRI